MRKVTYIHPVKTPNFTPRKAYKPYVYNESDTMLAVKDDTGNPHVIAMRVTTDEPYDNDPYFQKHFMWIDETDETEDAASNIGPKIAIVCAHCGHKHTNWQEFIDTGDMEGEFEEDCEACGKPFFVRFRTDIVFETKKSEDDEYAGQPSLDELFTSWTKELGYNRALLLSFNYPVSKVAIMNEEDAQAEIDALS